MKHCRKVLIVGVLCAVLVVMAFSTPVAAISRASGEYWTYDMTMNLEGVNVNGTVKYSFDKEDTLVVNGTSYDVNVMKIDGGLEATVDFFGTAMEVRADLGGLSYETRDGMAMVKEDAFIWMNTSISFGTIDITMRLAFETDTTYGPPLMSGFDPDTTGPGDSWDETVNMHMISNTWENESLTDTSTNDQTVVYSISVATSTQTVVTGAGTFETLRIMVTNTDDDSYELYWWSSEVENYVKQEMYEAGASEPYTSLSLKDYGTSGGLSTLLIVLIIVIAVIVVLALVVIMVMRRRPGQPVPYQPPPYPYQPPVPPPPGQ